jgi:hypothetical protein
MQTLSFLGALILLAASSAASAQPPADANKSLFDSGVPLASLLDQAAAADDQCMLDAAYRGGPLLSKPSTGQVSSWTRDCVRFDQGVGAWYSARRTVSGEPLDTTSEAAAKSLEGFRASSGLWLSLVLGKCVARNAPDAQSCLAFVRPGRPG